MNSNLKSFFTNTWILKFKNYPIPFLVQEGRMIENGAKQFTPEIL